MLTIPLVSSTAGPMKAGEENSAELRPGQGTAKTNGPHMAGRSSNHCFCFDQNS
jgi:hypothetical protein